MKLRTRVALVLVVAAAGAGSAAAQTSEKASTPKDTSSKGEAAGAAITPELIAQGDKIFHGAGNCYACHGTNAQGSVGPNLTDAEWIHSKGTYEDIVARSPKVFPRQSPRAGS
jgi:mono/diheme cytochrome c family protein